MSSFQRSALHLLGNIYHGEKWAVEGRQKFGGGGAWLMIPSALNRLVPVR